MTIEPQLSTQQFQWQPNKGLLILSLCLLPLLLALGFWQLDRAEEKQRILNHYKANQQAAPAVLADLNKDDDLQYRSAWLQGQLDARRRLILDNRVRNGRPGYEIFESMTIAGMDQKVLVNRGWVPASSDRAVLPEVEVIQDQVQLRGVLYQTLGGYRLDDGIDRVADWPVRVGWVSAVRAKTLFGEDFFPYQLRLDQDSPAALETGWATVSVQPAKHTGYAVQWFVMALVLLMMTVIANSNAVEWFNQRRSK